MTRDEILLAAAQLFGDKGFHGASMQEVANSVKLQKASLYHHVSSKQELLANILDKALDILIEGIERVVNSSLSPAEKIRTGLRVYLDELAKHPNLSAVLLLEHNSLEPKYREKHINRRDQFESMWRMIIEEGIKMGDFNCADSNLATKAALGMMNWTVTWYRKDGQLQLDEIAEQFSTIILRGLGHTNANE
jgi:TetR/AcrR family transcriptional regulator, cholesterol catabolism regulator